MLQAGSITQWCYLTTDIERATSQWNSFAKAGPFFRIECLNQEKIYRGRPATDSFIAVLGFLGTSFLEFIQPIDDKPSIFRELLDTKGEVLHHIQPNIRPRSAADYDAQFAAYEKAGLAPAVEMVVPGLGRTSFFDAVATGGVFVELVEVSEAMYRGLDYMYEVHRTWDGSRPIRDLMETFAA
jgi:hypothetical protein